MLGSSKGGDLGLALGLVAGEQVPTWPHSPPGGGGGHRERERSECRGRGDPPGAAPRPRPPPPPLLRPPDQTRWHPRLQGRAHGRCLLHWSPGLQELTEDMALPLESLQAELLMVVGEDDYNFDSVM